MSFDDNKVFNEQLGILTSVQVCKIISLRIDEEMLEESESEDQTLTLKNTSKTLPLMETQTHKPYKSRSGL